MGNNLVPIITLITLLFIVAQLYVPFMQHLFLLSPLPAQTIGFCLLVAMAGTFWLEIVKYIKRKTANKNEWSFTAAVIFPFLQTLIQKNKSTPPDILKKDHRKCGNYVTHSWNVVTVTQKKWYIFAASHSHNVNFFITVNSQFWLNSALVYNSLPDIYRGGEGGLKILFLSWLFSALFSSCVWGIFFAANHWLYYRGSNIE